MSGTFKPFLTDLDPTIFTTIAFVLDELIPPWFPGSPSGPGKKFEPMNSLRRGQWKSVNRDKKNAFGVVTRVRMGKVDSGCQAYGSGGWSELGLIGSYSRKI